MRTALVVLAALVSVIAPASAFAATGATGDVTAQRLPRIDPFSTFTLSFVAGGNQNHGTGQVTYTELQSGYSVTANVTCYYQEKTKPSSAFPNAVGKRAVFSGPVIAESPDQGTESFTVQVADGNDSPLGVTDFFDVFGGGPPGHNCAQDFALDRFDNFEILENAYYVASGNIVIR